MDWQKIETAEKPDSGEAPFILGYCWPTGVRIMRYSGWGRRTGPFETLEVADDGYAVWREFPATHWMPLPPAPALT